MKLKITYDDLKVENYVNTNVVGVIGNTDIYLADIGIAGLLAGLPQHYRGLQSSGKTQLMRDFYYKFFAGEEHALWEEGRADYRPRDLFQRLNISLAKGQADNLPEIKPIYANGTLEYLVQSYDQSPSGELKLVWKKISKEKRDEIIEKYSITTSDLIELKRISTKAFFIDEFNRCPEIVMNLFYGLMNGEILHDGKIIELGNGYYSGIAASNPEDFSGTFNMDPAMWSRFRVILDFTAYEINYGDDRKLIDRQEKPGIIKSAKGDLVKFLEETTKAIKHTPVTPKERAILLYFKKGLGLCTNSEYGGSNGISKKHINWPIDCKRCEKQTQLCGIFNGLDQRSVDAVKFLARGLEMVARLKDATEIDPIESLTLAYEFVAPYKGVANPRLVKEKRGIEGLVFKSLRERIVETLHDEFDKIEGFKRKHFDLKAKKSNLKSLEQVYARLGHSGEYKEISQKIKEGFMVRRPLTVEEYKEQCADEFTELTRSVFDEVYSSHEIPEDLYLDYIASNLPNVNNQLDKLSRYAELSKKEYKSMFAKDSLCPYDEFIERVRIQMDEFKNSVYATLRNEDENFREKVLELPEFKQAYEFNLERRLDDRLSQSEISFIPKEKKGTFKRALVKKLNERLAELRKDKLKTEYKKITSGEWAFMEECLDDFLSGESDNE